MVNASNSRFLYLRSLRPGVSLGCLLSSRARMVRSADEDDVTFYSDEPELGGALSCLRPSGVNSVSA